ncbi:MAG: hypothetical protein M5R36_11385 [Deltaproteobacteria bacterium]|nr:hypothetical protein [Deltaproteobacteria bacterium]
MLDAGRQWFEIWVPQDPDAWKITKLVFRDISEKPCFWIDKSDSVVNGDCYWMIRDNDRDEDLLWLAAAVANSRFIERYYDHRFNNKLYAGRRRFITQYVEKFPLPDPATRPGTELIALSKRIFSEIDGGNAEPLLAEINAKVFEAFGLGLEEIRR